MEQTMGNNVQILTDAVVFYAAMGLVGVLFSFLLILLAWIGSRVHNRLDDISKSLGAIERDLRSDLVTLDRRISKVEGHIGGNC